MGIIYDNSELLGRTARHLVTAVAFGCWQHSVAAGVFVFFAAITLEAQ